MSQTYADMNIYQKLLKIANMAGVLNKNRQGYNYKYTTEDEIQAKITAGMQKYGVHLYPSLVNGTLNIQPYHYEKQKSKNADKIPVNEIIVSAEIEYTWVNVDKPEEKVVCNWAYIGQMEDASQAFGAGATYGNRYFLMKALQLATTEADPDEYRSKQQQAEDDEAKESLKKKQNDIVKLGVNLINSGQLSKVQVSEIVAKYNKGVDNPKLIKYESACDSIIEEFNTYLMGDEPKENN